MKAARGGLVVLQTKQVRACNGVAGSGGGAAAATGEQCYNNSREEWAEQGGHQKMSQGAAWTVLIEVLERRAGGSRARPASARGPPMAGRVLHGLHIFPIFLYPRHACRKAFISCSSSWQASWPGQGGREGVSEGLRCVGAKRAAAPEQRAIAPPAGGRRGLGRGDDGDRGRLVRERRRGGASRHQVLCMRTMQAHVAASARRQPAGPPARRATCPALARPLPLAPMNG